MTTDESHTTECDTYLPPDYCRTEGEPVEKPGDLASMTHHDLRTALFAARENCRRLRTERNNAERYNEALIVVSVGLLALLTITIAVVLR